MEETMSQSINWWEKACRGAWPLRFVDINLRGIGQVMFQDNPLAGLVGFNPILTAIAVGTVFNRPGIRSALLTLLAVVLTVLVQGAMVAALTPFAIPTLTASFVLVTWLFLLATPDLATTVPPTSATSDGTSHRVVSWCSISTISTKRCLDRSNGTSSDWRQASRSLAAQTVSRPTRPVRQHEPRCATTASRSRTPRNSARLAGLCGKTLASAHARSGDAMMIRGYIGEDKTFDDVLVEYAD
jgi:hypothetical protein